MYVQRILEIIKNSAFEIISFWWLPNRFRFKKDHDKCLSWQNIWDWINRFVFFLTDWHEEFMSNKTHYQRTKICLVIPILHLKTSETVLRNTLRRLCLFFLHPGILVTNFDDTYVVLYTFIVPVKNFGLIKTPLTTPINKFHYIDY